MTIAAQIDEFGKPAWIVLMILSFVFFWPAGIALLAYLYGSGRMACWRDERRSRRYDEKMARFREKMGRWCGEHGNPAMRSSGNRAFDEYKAATLRRLEEEQEEFHAFLDRLRFAKDKAEFDDFLAERRNRPPTADPYPDTPPQNP